MSRCIVPAAIVVVSITLLFTGRECWAEPTNLNLAAQQRPSSIGRKTVEITLDLQNTGGDVDADLYFGVLMPNGCLYSFFPYVQEGLAAFRFTVPGGFSLDDFLLATFQLPSSCPPMIAPGEYWVYAVCASAGGPIAISNTASASFTLEEGYSGAWRCMGLDHCATRCTANDSYIVEPNYGEGGCAFTLYDYRTEQKIRSYSTVDGMPTNDVKAAALDADGNLWLATTVGITRWDGQQFENLGLQDGVPNARYNDIDIDSHGDVWAAGEPGLLRFHEAQWSIINQAQGHRLGEVSCVEASEALDSVYFGTATTAIVGFYHDGGWEILPSQDGPNGIISDLAVATDGTVWVTSSGICRFAGQTWESWSWIDQAYSVSNAHGMTVSDDGVLWVGLRFASSGIPTLIKFDGESWTDVSSEAKLTDTGVESVCRTPARDIFVGSRDGVRLLRDGTWRTITGPQLRSETVSAIELIGGELFVCSDQGLDSFRDGSWDSWDSFIRYFQGFPEDVEGITRDASGNLWVATGNRGVCRYDGTSWTQFTKDNSALTTNTTRWIKADLDYKIWVRLYEFMNMANSGLAVYDGATWKVYQVDDGLPSNSTYCLAFDAENTPWCGTSDAGAARLDGDTWTVFNTDNSGLPDNRVSRVAVDGSGSVWFNTRGGLAIYDSENWATVASLEQAVQEHYSDIVSGPLEKTDLWIVGPKQKVWLIGGNVRAFDGTAWLTIEAGEIPNTGTVNGLPAAAFDASGNLWVASSKPGGVRILEADVDEWSTIALASSQSMYSDGDQLRLSMSLSVQHATIRDFYCGLIVPSGTIYYYPAWSTTPYGFGVALHAGFEVHDFEVLNVTLPSSSPPVQDPGNYLFAAGLAVPGSMDFPDGIEMHSFRLN